MANTFSKSKTYESEMVPCCCRQLLSTIKESETVPKRPVMLREFFDAAIKGNRDVLIERLGLQTEEQKEIREDGDSNHQSTKDLPFSSEIIPLTQRTSPFTTKLNEDDEAITLFRFWFSKAMPKYNSLDSAPEKIRTEKQTVRSELQSATHSGDTVLHLLVTKKHNELALKVFERDPSLLKVQNKMLETDLHCAAKVGNQEVILRFFDIEPAVVKDVLKETNEKGDTALHVAVRYNHAHFCRNLMEFDSELAYTVNKEMFSPFHIALHEKRGLVAEQMLCVDPILACTQLTDGMFPVHLAACKNNPTLLLYFMKNFPDYVEFVDSRGRNLFHFVAEEATRESIFDVLSTEYKDILTRMNNATDYEGNTPIHIAAMKGHWDNVYSIWMDMTNCIAQTIKNNGGLTPYVVSRNQIKEIWKESWRIKSRICAHEKIIGEKFSKEWFSKVLLPPPSMENRWERTQVIGLGSVLITTVTFAAAFTIPGGYNNQENHTQLFIGVRYSFRSFILANTLAFIQGFISLLALLVGVLPGPNLDTLEFSSNFFYYAATSMVMTFGFGQYVTLAPLCMPVAIIVLVITMAIGCPFLFLRLFIALDSDGTLQIFTSFVHDRFNLLRNFVFTILFIVILPIFLGDWKSYHKHK